MTVAPELLPVACVAIALAIALAGSRAVAFTRWLALGGPLLAIVMGAQHLLAASAQGSAAPYVGLGQTRGIAWLTSALLEIHVAVDDVSAVMLLTVGAVAAMVIVFSFGYMAHDPAQPRYFALLSAFTGAMSGLVMTGSLLGLFIAWELVGACSFLLIGFWFTKPSAARAAMKAFMVTRVGDVGLLFALALLWRETGSLDLAEVVTALPALSAATVTTAALLLFVGAAGKSAQFPLHVWLPDAMEGPTPVSALIHAATMVAAGVFLIVRVWPVFEASEVALAVVLAIGSLTALGAATIAIVQTDIKRMLAYSTISQLGFMFAALGAGAWQAAFFHLVTHAAFKSLLFLASGSVIHGSGTQDMRVMGGLRTAMPVTALTWAVGVAALAGLPPLSGFFSKDAVLDSVWQHSPIAGGVLLLASACTAFYAFRATRLTFAGEPRGSEHAHESPATMTAPLVTLALLAAVLGATQWWFAHRFGGHAGLSVLVAVTSTVVAVAAGLVGWRVAARTSPEEAAPAALRAWWNAAERAYGIDALAMRVADAAERWASAVVAVFDRRVIDGAVMGVAAGARRMGAWAAALQSGDGSAYAWLVAAGAAALVAVSLWAGR